MYDILPAHDGGLLHGEIPPELAHPRPPISKLESRLAKGGRVRVSDILPVNIDIGGAGAHETTTYAR